MHLVEIYTVKAMRVFFLFTLIAIISCSNISGNDDLAPIQLEMSKIERELEKIGKSFKVCPSVHRMTSSVHSNDELANYYKYSTEEVAKRIESGLKKSDIKNFKMRLVVSISRDGMINNVELINDPDIDILKFRNILNSIDKKLLPITIEDSCARHYEVVFTAIWEPNA